MDRNRRTQVVVPLVISMISLATFSRTPGADAVRWVQILLLFAAGLCAGIALAGFFRRDRQNL
jgi:hypothetical protein